MVGVQCYYWYYSTEFSAVDNFYVQIRFIRQGILMGAKKVR